MRNYDAATMQDLYALVRNAGCSSLIAVNGNHALWADTAPQEASRLAACLGALATDAGFNDDEIAVGVIEKRVSNDCPLCGGHGQCAVKTCGLVATILPNEHPATNEWRLAASEYLVARYERPEGLS